VKEAARLPVVLPQNLWPHQRDFVEDPARFAVRKSATKCGKTTASAWWLADCAMKRPGGLFWWVGPTNDVGLIGYKTTLHLLSPIVIKKQERPWRFYIKTEPQQRFATCIALKTAQEPDHLMGAGVHGVVLDEAGLPEYDKAWPNILTTLTETNGRARIIGNPGDAGQFMDQAEQWGMDPNMPDWSFKQWKYLDRPTATQQQLDEYKTMLGEDSVEFRRYYLGETIHGAGGFFHNLDAVSVASPEEPIPGVNYLVGVDPCIRRDYFVASVFHIDERRQVYYSRYKGTLPEQQEEEIDRVARLYNDAVIVIEANGPGFPIARNLMQRGRNVYPFETSGKSKPEILYDYRSDIAHNTIRLLADEYQKREHILYQTRTTNIGTVKFSAPHGANDDMVMANAIANNGLKRAVNVEVLWAS
jgi:hypothetical protein